MRSSKPTLVKSPPGTHGYRHSPFLFLLMLAIIVLVFVFLIVRPAPHNASAPRSMPSSTQPH